MQQTAFQRDQKENTQMINFFNSNSNLSKTFTEKCAFPSYELLRDMRSNKCIFPIQVLELANIEMLR